MKKNLKKTLSLNKKTIASLNKEELDHIKGKATTLYTVYHPCTIPCDLEEDEFREN
jgi:hypothetical protein